MTRVCPRWLATAIGLSAVLGFLATYAAYSFCVLVENDCVLGRPGSCEAVQSTLRFCAIVAMSAIAAGALAIVLIRRAV